LRSNFLFLQVLAQLQASATSNAAQQTNPFLSLLQSNLQAFMQNNQQPSHKQAPLRKSCPLDTDLKRETPEGLLSADVSISNVSFCRLQIHTCASATARDAECEDRQQTRGEDVSALQTKAKGDGTMKRGKNLSVKDKLRNKRIMKKRAIGEHPFGTINRSFHGGRTKLTTTYRVFVQTVFVFMAYNIHRLLFLVNN
jgi:hypothetical protein